MPEDKDNDRREELEIEFSVVPDTDELVKTPNRLAWELANRGFIFNEEGQMITIDDLKLAHERAENDRESVEIANKLH